MFFLKRGAENLRNHLWLHGCISRTLTTAKKWWIASHGSDALSCHWVSGATAGDGGTNPQSATTLSTPPGWAGTEPEPGSIWLAAAPPRRMLPCGRLHVPEVSARGRAVHGGGGAGGPVECVWGCVAVCVWWDYSSVVDRQGQSVILAMYTFVVGPWLLQTSVISSGLRRTPAETQHHNRSASRTELSHLERCSQNLLNWTGGR